MHIQLSKKDCTGKQSMQSDSKLGCSKQLLPWAALAPPPSSRQLISHVLGFELMPVAGANIKLQDASLLIRV